MLKQIINIDEDKCVGCGLCANTCHQGAIEIIHGKAKLIKADYCDGLGRCLPVCPTNAISFTEEDIPQNNKPKNNDDTFSGCPSSRPSIIERKNRTQIYDELKADNEQNTVAKSELNQWPVQIQLVPANAPYFNNANLLIAADCTAFAYANFHKQFMKNKITIIGCPKLDSVNYSDKLTDILENNNIKSITVIRMEVPCCGGIVDATKSALSNSKKIIPWSIVTISTDGKILESI